MFVNVGVKELKWQYARRTWSRSAKLGRLTELAEDVVGHGREKVLTRNGAIYVALVDARKLDYYHALEAEHANIVLAQAALEGLEDVAAGRLLTDAELDGLLGVKPAKNRKKG